MEAKILSENEISQLGDFTIVNESSLIQFFDLDRFDGEIVVRSRLEGDRIRPYKSNGEKKLKKFFIDQKVPGEKEILFLWWPKVTK